MRLERLSERLAEAALGLERRVSELERRLALAGHGRRDGAAENERADARIAALLEALPAAVILVDRRGRVDRFNAQAERLFAGLRWGRRWAEVLGEDLLPRPRVDAWQLRGGALVEVSSRPLGELGQVLVLVDVTERRALEQRLRQQERLSALGEMAARLAHQLRTPMSAAVLYAGQLAGAEVGVEQRRHCAEKLLARLRHTERLIGDMLAFARGEPYRPEPLDLRVVVSDAVDMVAPLTKAAGARLVWQPGAVAAPALGNAGALAGVMVNILTNALEHGGAGVRIRLALRSDASHHEVTIEDNGPGIPVDQRGRVFEPFFTTRPNGNGLGLAVAHTVIVEHGGRIVCEGDHGARFLVSLPCAAASDADSWRQSA